MRKRRTIRRVVGSNRAPLADSGRLRSSADERSPDGGVDR